MAQHSSPATCASRIFHTWLLLRTFRTVDAIASKVMYLVAKLNRCIVCLAHEQVELVVVRETHLFHFLFEPHEVVRSRKKRLVDYLGLGFGDVVAAHGRQS